MAMAAFKHNTASADSLQGRSQHQAAAAATSLPSSERTARGQNAMGSSNCSIVENTTSDRRTPSSLVSLFNMTKRSSSLLVFGLLLQNGIALTEAFSLPTNTKATSSLGRPFLHGKRPFAAPGLPSQQLSRCFALQSSQAGSSPDATAGGGGKARNSDDKPGWRRRVFSKLRRKRSHKMSMKAVATMDEVVHPPKNGFVTGLDQFVLDNFEKLSPEQLFRTLEDSAYILDGGRHPALQPLVKSPLEEILPLVTPLENATSLAAAAAAGSSSSSNAMEAPTTTTSSSRGLLVEEEENLLLECIVPKSQLGAIATSFEGGPITSKAVRSWFQNLLKDRLHAWSAEPPVNMQVRCSPTGNPLWSIMRGELSCSARVDFDRMVFDFLRLSGGSIEGSRMALNLLAFTVDKSKIVPLEQGTNQPQRDSVKTASSSGKSSTMRKSKANGPRYQTQFDLHANDCILTQEDLFESKCVTNGLRNLLARILTRRGVRTSSIDVTDISILESGKISVKGEANVLGLIPKTVPFEVRSGIGFSRRGHVLTFPGLEISLSPDVGLFVPVLPTIELDVGHNARLREISIDGDNKLVKLAASVTITPKHTLKLNQAYIQSSHAYAARFSYDVGRWLTRIGRFSL